MTASTQGEKRPVAPYMAIGLSTTAYGIADRSHIKHNLEIIEDAIHAAVSIVSINMPVKVIALAEGALTGFTDDVALEHIVISDVDRNQDILFLLGQNLVDRLFRRLDRIVDQVAAPRGIDHVDTDIFFQMITKLGHELFPLLVKAGIAVSRQRHANITAGDIIGIK